MADVTLSKKAVEARISYGHFSTKPPFGYFYQDKRLLPHPTQAPIVKDIFSLRLLGASINGIAKRLQMPAMKIKRILDNPIYIGKLRWQGQVKDASHQPIIDINTFSTIQSTFSPKTSYSYTPSEKKPSYDFTKNKEKKLDKVKQGIFPSRPPFGYFIRDGKLLPKPSEALIVTSVFEKFSQGLSLAEIAREFSLSYLKTKRILQNPVYTGKILFNSITYDGKHTALISEQLFNQVHAKKENQEQP